MNDEQGILKRLEYYADCIDKGIHVTGSQLKRLVLDIREQGGAENPVGWGPSYPQPWMVDAATGNPISPPAEAQANWEVAPPGATHYQPHQGAYYKRVSASEWYVWSRMDGSELLGWLPSPGTSDSAEWVVPPAEAQAQGGGEAKWCEIHQHYKPCEHTAPPSAPVGVEVLKIIDKWMKNYDHMGTGSNTDARESEEEWEEDRVKLISILAQQPAADTYNRRLKAQLEQEWANLQDLKRAYQTQQPAAVDGAMVERALAAYLRRQEDGESLYGCVTAALTAALAGQQGGSDNDR